MRVDEHSMERVEADAQWNLFDPADVPKLVHAHGADFKSEYALAEDSALAVLTLPARQLLSEIMLQQLRTGTPAIVFSDSANGTKLSPAFARPLTHTDTTKRKTIRAT